LLNEGLNMPVQPNPRLQRTPSAPLSRQPLGRGVLSGSLCVGIVTALRCVSPADAERDRAYDLSINPTGGRLVFSAGSGERLNRSDSFSVVVNDLDGDTAAIQKALIKQIGNQFPNWRYTPDPNTADVNIDWFSGFTVCVDCGEGRILPQWARVQLEVHHGLARAQWTDTSHWRARSRLVDLFVVALARARADKAA
jgi:hypothetical protein